jgi:hypothetical protein
MKTHRWSERAHSVASCFSATCRAMARPPTITPAAAATTIPTITTLGIPRRPGSSMPHSLPSFRTSTSKAARIVTPRSRRFRVGARRAVHRGHASRLENLIPLPKDIARNVTSLGIPCIVRSPLTAAFTAANAATPQRPPPCGRSNAQRFPSRWTSRRLRVAPSSSLHFGFASCTSVDFARAFGPRSSTSADFVRSS